MVGEYGINNSWRQLCARAGAAVGRGGIAGRCLGTDWDCWEVTGIAGRCLDSDWDLSEAAALVVVALQGGFGGSPSSAQPCPAQSQAFAEALPVRS